MRLARLQRADEVDLRISSVGCSKRINSGQELKQVLLALMRTLAEGAEKGACVDTELRTDEKNLVVVMKVESLAESSAKMLARFDVLGERTFDGAHVEFGLGIVAELIDQLGGGLMVEAIGPNALRLEVSVPLITEGASS
jgi:hypothetical protein